MRINEHLKIDEDDDIDEFNIEDCDGDDDDGIKERKRRQFWISCKTWMCNEINFNVIFFFMFFYNDVDLLLHHKETFIFLWFYYFTQNWCYCVMILIYLPDG